jgi:CheY-like chemotaxis protein
MSVSILVVADEPDVAELFRQRFRREARQGTYVMHFSSSGEDALSKLNNGVDPQLIVILSDINMPEMDGLTLLGEIKQRWPELPVMMVTAYGDDERRRRADEYGAAGFLTKPVDFDSAAGGSARSVDYRGAGRPTQMAKVPKAPGPYFFAAHPDLGPLTSPQGS